MTVKQIRKRDGRLDNFNPEKITQAIFKAMKSVGREDFKLAKKLSAEVVRIVEEKFGEKEIPNVEDVQDIVETVLMKSGLSDVAKSYILYRQKRTEVREAKKLIGVADDLKLSINAIKV